VRVRKEGGRGGRVGGLGWRGGWDGGGEEDLAFQFYLFFILDGVGLVKRIRGGGCGGLLTLYGAYHFARRVLPLADLSIAVMRSGWDDGVRTGGSGSG
jgi:hypothetical protein